MMVRSNGGNSSLWATDLCSFLPLFFNGDATATLDNDGSDLDGRVMCDNPSSGAVDCGGPLSLSRVWLDDIPLSQSLLPLLLSSDNDGNTHLRRHRHLPLFFSLLPLFLFSSFLTSFLPFFLSNRVWG
ncbi:hypothetical protein AAHE18_17G110600 [Arachis hypogaea]